MFAKAILPIRKVFNLTQQGFADRIGEHRDRVARWERETESGNGAYLKALESIGVEDEGEEITTRISAAKLVG